MSDMFRTYVISLDRRVPSLKKKLGSHVCSPNTSRRDPPHATKHSEPRVILQPESEPHEKPCATLLEGGPSLKYLVRLTDGIEQDYRPPGSTPPQIGPRKR